MKSKTSPTKSKIEHRGFDVSATRNYDLEMRVVNNFNHVKNKEPKKSNEAENKTNKEE